MDRRTFLTTSGSLVAAGALSPKILLAQPKPLTYYNINAFSGNFANSGKLSELGVRVAVKAFGNKLGRPVEYRNLDTEGNPAVAARKVQQALEQERARIFGGGALSSEALAVMKDIHRAGGSYFTYVGADEVTGKDCSKSTFRWSLPTYGAVRGVLPQLIQAHPQWKRFYTITGQYVFGEDLLRNTKAVLSIGKLEHAGNSYHALGEKEFSGYLGNAMSSGADVLVLLNFGANTLDLLRQAASFGLKKKMAIVAVWFGGLDTFRALGPDVMEGVYVGMQYWHTLDTPGNKEFLKHYRAEFQDTPRFYSAADYQVATLLLDAVKRAGSDDQAAVAKALEGYRYQGLTGEEEIRAADHQVAKNYLLMRSKAKGAMRDQDDFAELIATSNTLVPLMKSECSMA